MALSGLANTEVARVQLGKVAAPPEESLGVPATARFGHGALHVLLHVREGSKVLREDGGGFLDGDAKALGEPVSLHPISQTVGDHLRLRAHGEGHRFWLDAVDPGGSGVVDVEPGTKRLDQSGVVR